MKRRKFAATGLTGLAAGISGLSMNTAEAAEVKREMLKPYGVQYYERAVEVWNREAASELPIIIQAADKATETLKNGGKLYNHAHFGHMLVKELRIGRPGNPDYLPTGTYSTKDEEYDPIGKGDFLFFDGPKLRVKKAHDRGAFTLGARVPYLPNKTTPQGILTTLSATDNLLTEDCSDLVLTSGVPFCNGVLNYPEIPAVRGCPLSVQGVGNFYWMLSAEIAMRDKGKGPLGKGDKAAEYLRIVKQRGLKIRNSFDSIDAVAKAMTGYVAQGAKYFCFSFGCEMADENTYRASGLAMTRNIVPHGLEGKVKAGDFVIIGSELSDTSENIEAAQAFKNAGMKIIYIGPGKTEGSAGDNLPKYADHHIETFSPERDGVLTVPGFDKKICPTTGVLYALTLWMLNAQFIAHMIEADMTPVLNMGGHLIGGSAFNKDVRAIADTRGY